MASPHKPLPAVPTRYDGASSSNSNSNRQLSRLSIDGRAHLRNFVRYALSEEDIHGGRAEEWVDGIEVAMNELAVSMARGGWLAGVKRARKLRSERREREERERRRRERERVAAEKEAMESKGKGKAKEVPLVKNATHDVHDPKLSGVKSRTSEERKTLALDQIRRAASSPAIPTPKPPPKHLVLILSKDEEVEAGSDDMDLEVVPFNRACSFVPGVFAFPPEVEGGDRKNTSESSILFGLDEWDVDEHDTTSDTTKLVGGTFTFKGITSPSSHEYTSLAKILRLAIYTTLSIVLEQHLLANSHVELLFPPAPTQPLVYSYSSPAKQSTPVPSPPLKDPLTPTSPFANANASGYRHGFWSMFSKRAEHILQKATSSTRPSAPPAPGSAAAAVDMKRAGSLDGAVAAAALDRRRGSGSPRTSEDLVVSRPTTPIARSSRRISFVAGIPRSWTGAGAGSAAGAPSSSITNSTAQPSSSSPPSSSSKSNPTFTTLLTHLTSFIPILSTSPLTSTHIPPPRLLISLAEKERAEPGRKVSGEEKAALGSLCGWGDGSMKGKEGKEGREGKEGKEGRGKGMYGLEAFVRHQGLTVLYAEYGPAPKPTKEAEDGGTSTSTPPKSSQPQPQPPQTVPDVVIAAVAVAAAAKEVDSGQDPAPSLLIPPPHPHPSLPHPSTSTPSSGTSLSPPRPDPSSSSSPIPQPSPIPIPSPSPVSLQVPPPVPPPSRASQSDVSKKLQASEANTSTSPKAKAGTGAKKKGGGGGGGGGGVLCERGRWVSYRYYSRGRQSGLHLNPNSKESEKASTGIGAKSDSKEREKEKERVKENHTAILEKDGVSSLAAVARDRDADTHHSTSTSTSNPNANANPHHSPSAPPSHSNSNNANVIHDDPLGAFIERSCSADVDSEAMEACKRPGCDARRWEHERVWIHGDVRVAARVEVAMEKEKEKEKEKGDKEKDGDGGKSDDNEKEKEKKVVEAKVKGGDAIVVWESCAECGERTGTKEMSDGAYLMSFAKYLELLIYSETFCTLTPPLCEHTTPAPSTSSSHLHPPLLLPPNSNPNSSSSTNANITSYSNSNSNTNNQPSTSTSAPSLPTSRYNIIRHFTHGNRSISFYVSPAPDVFELRIPRLQILRGRGVDGGPKGKGKSAMGMGMGLARSRSKPQRSTEGDEARKKLRREIKMWWQGVTDHMDKIENHIASEHNVLSRKSLPRLPSTIDPYEDDILDESTIPEEESLQSLPPLPPSPPASPKLHPTPDPPEDRFSTRTSLMRLVAGYYAAQPPNTRTNSSSQSQPPDASTLLSNLRYSFQRSEQALYAQLSRTPTTNLNDVRREFAGVARGAERRLYAWQNKHARATGEADLGKLVTEEPEWWKMGCHAIPGGKVVVREGEWGSIISFTLSSADYQRELANMSATRQGSTSTTSSPLSNASTKTSTGTSSTTATSNGYSVLSNGPFKHFANVPTPDPDQESPIWQESEPHSAAISRHEHPRDQSGLLSLRDVLRHRRSSADNGSNALLNSRFGSMGLTAASKFARVGTPPSAWAKPAVEVSMQAAGGLVSGLPDTSESAEKILMEMEPFVDGSASLSSSTSSSGFIETHIRSGKAGSIISIESDSTLGPDTFPPSNKQQETPPKSVRSRSPARGISTNPETRSNPASRDSSPNTRSNTMSSHASSTVQTTMSEKESESGSSTAPSVEVSPDPVHSHEQTETTVSSVATTLTSTFTQAAQVVRSMLNPEPLPRAPSPAHHHALLTMDSSSIDERPHIKYDWTIGKRLKFSCTVYYAKQFDALRKKCGMDDDFLKSLERSENWAAEGGKSKSNFWKTSDDRFIIKTLVNAWNVADLQVLIEMGPSYFKYIDSTANRPSVLAKLLGFYTVEIKNLETGNVQAKADLLVMENLFYDQKISKTFDLKGIQGRKVKASGSSAPSKKILFDGEWIEGQQKVLTLVYPYSKVVLREAVKADADFLSKSNIMDYSLLLGIDEERRQIACGLVDTIGSYTFAKTLEYKAKQNLNSGKEVTVIPPNEYHDRFITAMNSYFLSCPDKWSRSSLETVPEGESLLPSVL